MEKDSSELQYLDFLFIFLLDFENLCGGQIWMWACHL